MKSEGIDLFQEKIYRNAKAEKMPYRFLEPQVGQDKGKRYPLVIAFHGAGERGDDNRQQVGNGLQMFVLQKNLNNFPCYVIVPQCPLGKRWVEVDWNLDAHRMPDTPSTYMRLSMELLKEVILKYPVDTTRLYITGLSMGGFATWDAICRYPGKFAAAAPVCGGGDENQAPLLVNTPIWAFHGGKDKVVKTIRSRNMIAAIQKVGGHPIYTEYPGMGHNSWDSAYRSQKLLPWMFDQRLK